MKFQPYAISQPFYDIIRNVNKEGLNLYQAHKKRIVFIEKAVGEGALDKIPVSERDQNIGLVYNLNEELTGEKVAKIYPNPSGRLLTNARIYQISGTFLRESWNYASPQLQAFHPLEELLTRRPNALGELDLRAKSMVEKGITDPKEIQDALAISTQKLVHKRIVLRRWGIDIPRIHKSCQQTSERIAKENDDKKLQEFLKSFSVGSLMYFFHCDFNHEILTTLAVIARNNGFRFHNSQVESLAVTIEEAKIPITQIVRRDKNGRKLSSYYPVFRKHEDRIAEVLGNDPNIQRVR